METHGNNVEKTRDRVHELEWMIGAETLDIDAEVVAHAYAKFCEELVTARKESKH